MPPEFECNREVVLPASPEQVWEAVATTAGNAAWLFPNEIAPDGSGATAWDPPHHFAVRMEQGDWFNALEFIIEGRDGGTSVLRYAHSGIFVDNWDTQYDAVQQHTDFYLHTLGEYLQHFNGRAATYIGGGPGGLQGPTASAAPDGFRRLQQAIGLSGEASESDRVRLTPHGLEPFEATIDYLRPNFIGVRTVDALYRFFGRNAFGGPVAISIHAFSDSIDAEKTRHDWQNWLDTALV
jgi:uncharacterized protein YndB with AHSA1/START domain